MNPYNNLMDRFIRTRLGGWMFLHVFNPIDRRLIRWTKGVLNVGLGTDYHGNLVLLRCTGARTGRQLDVPLLATPLDGRFILVGSAGGRERTPSWYYNLLANPNCSLLIRGQGEVPCVAHEAAGEERDRAWAAANAQYSGYNTYQGRITRRVPVFILTPTAGH